LKNHITKEEFSKKVYEPYIGEIINHLNRMPGIIDKVFEK